MRLDQYLTENGLVESRNKGASLIKSSYVKVNGKIVLKPSYNVLQTDDIKIIKNDKYVARSAYKLLTAINNFKLDFKDKIVVDIGASTGGFTQVAIENGAKKVYAVDVGHSQLHKLLLNNDKVKNFEKINARFLEKSLFEDEIDIVTCDVSFISIKKIIPAISRVLNKNSIAVCLIKPQFELEKKNISKSGVANDKKLVYKSILSIFDFAKDNELYLENFSFCGIKGESGNIEYIALFNKIKHDINYNLLKLYED